MDNEEARRISSAGRGTPADPKTAGAGSGKGFNWFRFWVRSAIALLVFNIIAALLTWYFIFPRLHPGMQ